MIVDVRLPNQRTRGRIEGELIVNLGRHALRQAAKDLSRWQQFFPSRPALYVSVNVTWRQIADETFARELATILKRAGLPKDSLRLEVTESAVMAGAESARTIGFIFDTSCPGPRAGPKRRAKPKCI